MPGLPGRVGGSRELSKAQSEQASGFGLEFPCEAEQIGGSLDLLGKYRLRTASKHVFASAARNWQFFGRRGANLL
jgi:hypothetical protein